MVFARLRVRRLAEPWRTAGWTVAAAAIGVGLSACCHVGHVDASATTFRVRVERGTRRTSAGDRVSYSLFLPQTNDSPAAPPYPAIVLSHGFARSQQQHHHTACTLASRGIIVLTPDLTSLLGGEPAQVRNIRNLVDQVRWLRARAADERDALYGLLAPQRMAVVGHSAGAAISFEAAIELAGLDEAVQAVMLLDGVPWTRTLAQAGELHDVAFASVRSEPAPCNAEGAIVKLLTGLSFATEDLRVVDGTHCDPESPTDCLCELACGGSVAAARAAYQDLLYAFLHDALSAPDVGATPGYAATVDNLAAAGRVLRQPIGAGSGAGP